MKDHPWVTVEGVKAQAGKTEELKEKQKPIRHTGAVRAMVIIGVGRNRFKAGKGKAGRVRIERLPAGKDKE